MTIEILFNLQLSHKKENTIISSSFIHILIGIIFVEVHPLFESHSSKNIQIHMLSDFRVCN